MKKIILALLILFSVVGAEKNIQLFDASGRSIVVVHDTTQVMLPCGWTKPTQIICCGLSITIVALIPIVMLGR
jgi:hypothetical protein